MDEGNQTRDAWLALRCQSGENEAFNDLVSTMERPLFYYALKLTRSEDIAYDILQETWLRAFRNIRSVKDPERLRAWLYRLVHGIYVDAVRRDSARERAEEQHGTVFDEAIDESLSTANSADIHVALDQIEPHLREVLVLHFLEDFTLADISQIVNCPEGTVKSRLHYAKKAMKVILTRGNA
jgi:RNA polymerase sigma-70 factor, ECF subfamily